MGRLGTWGVAVLLVACSERTSATPAHDASLQPVDSAFSSVFQSEDSSAPDVDESDAAQAWGPDPPKTPCDSNANSTAVQCPYPPAVCADSRWIVIYTAPSCVSGACTWQKEDLDCTMVAGTCGTSPGQDAGSRDAQVAFVPVGNGIGCIVPAPTAPPPPKVDCDEDATQDAALCAPPPSVCAVSKSPAADRGWLVYYDNGVCMAGQCVWQARDLYCPNGCFSGTCSSGSTVPSPTAPN